jgi:hypothetical protein
MKQICNKCNIEKDILEFRSKSKKNKIYYAHTCKKCVSFSYSKYRKIHYLNNKEQYNNKSLKYYNQNKHNILKQNKKRYEKNKINILEKQKKYQQKHLKNHNEINKNYRKRIKRQQEQNFKNSKNFINFFTGFIVAYMKKKEINNINSKIRKLISGSINDSLKKNNSTKQKKSCLMYLSYTIQDLKNHLESLFEPWMTWENHGVYWANIWRDNDQTTWTWQIDHIIPHSLFQYTSMEDQSFKDCWNLNNLRPYSAKQNIVDGLSGIRHGIING